MSLARLMSGLLSCLVCGITLTGCSAGDGQPGNAPPAEQQLGRFRIGPAGGKILLTPQAASEPLLQGLSLDIPAGALSADVEFTVSRLGALPAAVARPDEKVVGPVLRIEPELPGLGADATLWVPYQRESVDYTYEFLVAHNADRSPAGANPLSRVVVAARPALAFPTRTLGLFAPVIKLPPTLPMGIPHRCDIQNIDILFVIDNSPSMRDKQAILVDKLPGFLKDLKMSISTLQNNRKDMLKKEFSIHLGIISTDVGIGYSGPPVTTGPFQYCVDGTTAHEIANGDDGLLQDKSCLMRTDFSPALTTMCKSLCADHIATTDGNPYIVINAHMDGSIDTNLPMSPDPFAVITKAFACRAFLGDQGCGVELPFESVRRALNRNEGNFFRFNQPATRGNSILLLVQLSDEDDQSPLDMSTLAYESPLANDTPKTWHNFNPDFRGFAMSTTCTEDFAVNPAKKTNCQQDTKDSYLLPIDMNNPPNGSLLDVLMNPVKGIATQNVLIAGIWPMFPLRFQPKKTWDDTYGGLYQIPVTLGPNNDLGGAPALLSVPCDPLKSQSMTRAPQHRLSHLATVDGAQATFQADICEPSQYEQALDLLVSALVGSTMTMCP